MKSTRRHTVYTSPTHTSRARRRALLGTSTALILTALLTGCGPASADFTAAFLADTDPSSALPGDPATAAGTATPTPEPSQLKLAVGDTIPDGAELRASQSAYALLDGRNVVVDRAMPVSEEVLADGQARGRAVTNYSARDDEAQFALMGIAMTFKKTMVITQMQAVALTREEIKDPNAIPSPAFMFYVRGNPMGGSHIEAEIDADVAAYIAKNGGAEAGWQVVKLY